MSSESTDVKEGFASHPVARGGRLQVIASHEAAVEMGRKGGSSDSIKLYLSRKRKCVGKGKKKCMLYDKCMLVPLALQSGRCEVNFMEPAKRQRILRLLQGSPEAIKDELMSQMHDILEMVSDNPTLKGKLKVVDRLMAMYKTVFDKGHQAPVSGNVFVFNWQLGGQDTDPEEKVVESKIEKEEEG